MNNRNKVYLLQLILFAITLLTIFSPLSNKRLYFSIFMCFYAFLTSKVISKRSVRNSSHKYANIILIMFAIIFLLINYLFGIESGFYEAPYKFGVYTLTKYIIPIVIIIILTEIVRYIFTNQESNSINFFTLIITSLIAIIISIDLYDASSLNSILNMMGYVVLSSIICNALFNYLSPKFGYIGIIVYQIITLLYIYIIPIIPNIYMFFRSFMKIIYPIIIFFVFEKTFERNKYAVSPFKRRRKEYIMTAVTFVVSISIIALVSCNFKYSVIVVGSGSMTPAILKGDIVFYEKTDNVKKGDVIVFDYNDIVLIHRVTDISYLNNRLVYFTKGDANDTLDDDYRVYDDLKGKVLFKIPKVGYINIWLRETFN